MTLQSGVGFSRTTRDIINMTIIIKVVIMIKKKIFIVNKILVIVRKGRKKEGMTLLKVESGVARTTFGLEHLIVVLLVIVFVVTITIIILIILNIISVVIIIIAILIIVDMIY